MRNNIKKYFSLLLIIIIIVFSFANSSSVYNIDHLAYAVALGIDVGENNNLKLSFQLSVPGSSSQGSGSSQSDESVINTIECSSIDSGINLLNSYISKEINLSHCKVIVFSEEFAYTGLSDSIYTLMNNIQVRPDCNVIISRCSAEYFLNHSQPVLEKLSARYYEVVPSSSDYTGYTEDITLSQFFSDLNDTFSQCYGILGGINTEFTQTQDSSKSPSEKDSSNKANETSISSKASIENMGLAVFYGDKLVGELTGIDTVCHQIVSSKLNICNIDIPSPFEQGKTISLRLRLCSTNNDVKLTNNGPYITCKTNLEGRILSMTSNSEYLKEDNIKLIEEYANSYMKSHISNYLYKLSKDFNSDIDRFGRYAVRNFSTWEDWQNYNWLANFNNSFFDVDVDIDVKSGYILM